MTWEAFRAIKVKDKQLEEMTRRNIKRPARFEEDAAGDSNAQYLARLQDAPSNTMQA